MIQPVPWCFRRNPSMHVPFQRWFSQLLIWQRLADIFLVAFTWNKLDKLSLFTCVQIWTPSVLFGTYCDDKIHIYMLGWERGMIMPSCTRRLPGSSGFLCHATVSGAATRWKPVSFSPRGMACFLPDWGKRWQACWILTGRPCQQGIMLVMAPARHSQLIMSLSPSRSISRHAHLPLTLFRFPNLYAVSIFAILLRC